MLQSAARMSDMRYLTLYLDFKPQIHVKSQLINETSGKTGAQNCGGLTGTQLNSSTTPMAEM